MIRNSVNMVKDQTKRKLSAMVVGKSLVRYRIIATFKKKGWMKLIHTGKYMTQLLYEDCHDHENEVFVRLERSGNR